MIKKIIFLFIFYLFFNPANAKEDIMIMKLKDGDVIIELFGEVAPNHVKRFKLLLKRKNMMELFFTEL